MRDASKWTARPLKAGWYDDHIGFEAQTPEGAPNPLRLLDAATTGATDGGDDGQVRRFFDLFDLVNREAT